MIRRSGPAWAAALLWVVIGTAGAQSPAGLLDQGKTLAGAENFNEAVRVVSAGLGGLSSAERFDALVLLCEWQLRRGDEARAAGTAQAEVLALFTQGRTWAEQAQALRPASALGFYWRAVHQGRIGQTRGILDSLGLADPMRQDLTKALAADPNHPESYYVLSVLYRSVPGFPLSFGDSAVAVTNARRALSLGEAELAAGTPGRRTVSHLVTELAQALWARNWDASRRRGDPGSGAPGDDRAEARSLLRRAEALLAAETPVTRLLTRDRAGVAKLKSDWGL